MYRKFPKRQSYGFQWRHIDRIVIFWFIDWSLSFNVVRSIINARTFGNHCVMYMKLVGLKVLLGNETKEKLKQQ